MPIQPAGKYDRDAIASLMLLAWAFLKATRDVSPTALLEEWREMKKKYEEESS